MAQPPPLLRAVELLAVAALGGALALGGAARSGSSAATRRSSRSRRCRRGPNNVALPSDDRRAADGRADLPARCARGRPDHGDDGHPGPDPFSLLPSTPQTSQSLGSGFVVDKAGHIVTNYHVIQGAKKVQVSFSGQDEITATVVGKDPSTDLAVLKIDAHARALTPLELGDSDAVVVGEPVVAIGNPFGFTRTLTPASSARCSGRSRRRTRCRSTMRSRPTPRSTTATRVGR